MSEERSARIPSLDGLRALAVMLVMVSHAVKMPALARPGWTYLFSKLINGILGVQLFFTISGFIITYLLIKDKSNSVSEILKNFYLRRVIRIFPPLIIYLIIIVILKELGIIITPVIYIASSLLFFRNHLSMDWPTFHFWSLSVEEQFYLLWPSLLLTLRHREWVLWGVMMGTPLIRWELLRSGIDGTFWLVTNMDCLAAGCLLALRYPQWQSWESGLSERTRGAMRVLALGSFAATTAMPGRFYPYWGFAQGTIIALAAAYLILSLTTSRRGSLYAVVNTRWIVALGIISYDLYIWQQIFLAPQPIVTQDPLIAMLLALTAGFLSWNLTERPLLHLRRRLRTEQADRGRATCTADDASAAAP